MKKYYAFGSVAVLAIILLASCEKTEHNSVKWIEGTYVGTLTHFTKTGLTSENIVEAKADISIINSELIEVHCYGGQIDTTFFMNYYHNNDSLMVCFNDASMTHSNSHAMGRNHMQRGMMDNDWQHHRSNWHRNGENPLGGFDKNKRSFGYRFTGKSEKDTNFFMFQGFKQ